MVDFESVSTSISVYRGSRLKLVLAFDVGTTYSSISYRYIPPCQCYALNRVFVQIADACLDSFLYPGKVPEIKGVMR
jgi:hypothetical protein